MWVYELYRTNPVSRTTENAIGVKSRSRTILFKGAGEEDPADGRGVGEDGDGRGVGEGPLKARVRV